jgi:hypothetical protein
MVSPPVFRSWMAAWLALTLPISSDAAARRSVYCGTDRWVPYILEAAQRFELRPAWVRAVIHVESGGCNITSQGPVTSSAGAMGLMQLMPETWSRLHRQLHLGSDPYQPRDNILAGVAYLRELLDAFGESGVFAAYHAGPKRYSQWLLGGRPLPPATLDYLERLREPLASTSDSTLLHWSSQANLHAPMEDRDAASHRHYSERFSAARSTLFVTLQHATPTSASNPDEALDVQPQ